jgi:hypothetical protein
MLKRGGGNSATEKLIVSAQKTEDQDQVGIQSCM